MSEAKNAEAELISLIEDGIKSITLCEAEDESSYTILDAIADTLGDKDIKRASEMVGDHAAYIATSILAAGYAKREDVLEEAAKVCDGGERFALKEKQTAAACLALNLSTKIRSLKGQP